MATPVNRSLRAVALVTAVCALGFGLAVPASAAPSDSTATGTRDLGVLSERYNLTRIRLDKASAEVAATQSRLAAAHDKAESVKALVRARSARLYQGATGGSVTAVMNLQSVNELGRRTEYVAAAARPDQTMLRTLTRTMKSLDEQEQALVEARDKLRAEAESMAAARKKLMAEAAAAAAKARTSQGDGAGPVGTPRAMMVSSSATGARPPATPATAAPVAAAPTPTPTTPPSTSAPVPTSPTPPAPSGGAATAVAYARAQLGKPYVFATSGPNSFDCSGLTMAAWRAAGVSMAHYSVSQANSFPKVAWAQLQPGDLVIFYADYHHVGIYIGGGAMIHAPQTGDVVKIAPAWRETFQFGVRPR